MNDKSWSPFHSITFHNNEESQEVTVVVELEPISEFEFEDGDTVEEVEGRVVLSFSTHERRIEAVAANHLELVGRLMMLAEAYIARTCEVENLQVYKHVKGDINPLIDVFR